MVQRPHVILDRSLASVCLLGLVLEMNTKLRFSAIKYSPVWTSTLATPTGYGTMKPQGLLKNGRMYGSDCEALRPISSFFVRHVGLRRPVRPMLTHVCLGSKWWPRAWWPTFPDKPQSKPRLWMRVPQRSCIFCERLSENTVLSHERKYSQWVRTAILP